MTSFYQSDVIKVMTSLKVMSFRFPEDVFVL